MLPTISLIGIPTDQHSSFLRGAAAAPAAIRAALASPHGNSATERLTEIGHDFQLLDIGDVAIAENAGDDDCIRAAVAAAPSPLIALGGDHSISFPVVETLARRHSAFDILHFDAHPDIYDELDGNRRSHASPFARIMEGGHARRLVQVGIRTLNRHCREQAARFGVEIIEARHFSDQWRPRFDRPLYVSIDLDALDPAFAPGVSHHEPGGLSVRQIIAILLDLDVPIIGGDVVELNPSRDINGMTAVVAAKLVKELAAAMAANPLR
ncbi:arginase family protein [Sandarakinorhabdus sp.]|uniref:arginase family protein n=1 Tax=Sandarakinorhabdus sp. TaxID=1916663 RepID=UPI0035641D61